MTSITSSTHSKIEESASHQASQNSTSAKFYGQVEKTSSGIFSSLIKRKSRKIPDDCKPSLKQLDAYKLSADKMHKALMYLLVENVQHSKHLHTSNIPIAITMDRPYRNLGEFLGNFEKCQKKSRKGVYEPLEPAIESLRNLSMETDSYVKKQLDVLKPLITFIGQEYWEYARLRTMYLDSLEGYDHAITAQSKERNEQAEVATQNAMKLRNDCKTKMMDYVHKLMNDQRPKHADCIVKFAEEASKYHTKLVEILSEAAAAKSTITKPTK